MGPPRNRKGDRSDRYRDNSDHELYRPDPSYYRGGSPDQSPDRRRRDRSPDQRPRRREYSDRDDRRARYPSTSDLEDEYDAEYRNGKNGVVYRSDRDEVTLPRSKGASKNDDEGEPHTFDPEFRGPLRNRSCTDIFFLIIFIIFLLGWTVIAYVAVKHGNPQKLIRPTDSNGNLCGVGNYSDRPKLFFFDLSKCKPIFKDDEIVPTFGCWTYQVCVPQCPNETFSAIRYLTQGDPKNMDEFLEKLICIEGVEKTKDTYKQLLTDGKCAPYYLKASSVSSRCIPDINNSSDLVDELTGNGGIIVDKNGNKTLDVDQIKKQLETVKNVMQARAYAQTFVEDVAKCWEYILAGLFIAMIFAFLYIVLMRFFAGIILWFSIFAMIFVFSWASYVCFKSYSDLEGQKGTDEPLKFSRKISFYTHNRTFWLILGIVSSIILAILVITLLFLRTRVKIAIALIKEGAKVIGHMPSALFFPLLPYILQTFVIAMFVIIFILLASSQSTVETMKFNLTNETTDMEKLTHDVEVMVTDKYVSYAHVYNFFGFLWAMAFVSAVGQLALAGAVATYYWAFRKPQDVPFCAVLSGLWMTFRYHLGSAAFGSLIIAIVQFIRACLAYVEKKLKKYDNDFVKFMLRCCGCCMWLLEKFLKFINKNAYIMIAIYGKNFCWSAQEAFMLLLRNAVRVVVLDKVTDFLLFIAKLVVVGGCGLASYYFFTKKIDALNSYVPDLNYQITPVIVITVGAYIIASCFFHVYDMTVDTLFLCFLEDCERNDGTKEKPYYMSKELMKILNKKNYREVASHQATTSQ